MYSIQIHNRLLGSLTSSTATWKMPRTERFDDQGESARILLGLACEEHARSFVLLIPVTEHCSGSLSVLVSIRYPMHHPKRACVKHRGSPSRGQLVFEPVSLPEDARNTVYRKTHREVLAPL